MSATAKELPETLPRWDIPSDWQWVSLAGVGKVITGNTPPTKVIENYGSDIPFVKPPELVDRGIAQATEGLSQLGMKTARLLPKGAVLVSCIGGLGKTGLAKVPMAFNQQINAIVFDEHVLPEYGFYYAQTLKPWLYGVASATTLPIVNKGKFHRAPFPLAPIDQQKRIVAEIEKQFSHLDEAVANLKRVKANLKRYKAAVLKAAVEGKLTEAWREAHPEVESASKLLDRILAERRAKWEESELAKMEAKGKAPKNDKWKAKCPEPAAYVASEFRELPRKWVMASLDQLSWHSGYGTSARCAYENDGVPILRIPNIDKAEIDLSDVKFAPSDLEVSDCESLAPNDMLVIRTNGSRSLIGRAAIVAKEFQETTYYASYLIRFRLLGDKGLARWLSSYWQSTVARAWVEERAATSAGQHNISMSVLATAPVPVPPEDEQQRIVTEVDRHLSLVRDTETQVETNLKRAERLRQSILSRAFSGQLVANGAEQLAAAAG